jgi:hypothetical protein
VSGAHTELQRGAGAREIRNEGHQRIDYRRVGITLVEALGHVLAEVVVCHTPV